MSWKRRFFLAGVPVHVVQRGDNRQAGFFDDSDYRVYLDWPGRAAGEHRCSIYAYALITDHVHVLMTPGGGGAISVTLQALGRRFEPYINHSYGGSGTLGEGRFRASSVQEESYLARLLPVYRVESCTGPDSG